MYIFYITYLKSPLMKLTIMEKYFAGKELYGDDFNIEEIKEWYEDEKEGYADLGAKEISKYEYHYHTINSALGYSQLPKDKIFENVLGFGAAYGYELEPVSSQIENIYIIEPSDQMTSHVVGGKRPIYVKPTVEGRIEFEDNYFDLITCFDTLHHIPNVSYVLSELIRCLKPGGYLLLKEPIISMGDWREPRPGLTKRERGIPESVFEKEFQVKSMKVIRKTYCYTMTSFLQRKFGKIFKKPIYSYKMYVKIDKLLSRMLQWNIKYHHINMFNRISPTSIFYILKKE